MTRRKSTDLNAQVRTMLAAQFFSRPFVRQAVSCDTRLAGVIAKAIYENAVKQRPDITVGDLIDSLNDGKRKSILDAIGRKDTQARNTFDEFCGTFGITDFHDPEERMHSKDYRLSDDAIAILDQLTAQKE